MNDQLAAVRQRSGMDVAGVFAFGDSPELADALLDFVRRGTKRATAGSLAEQLAEDSPFPQPGQRWGLLDGRGEAQFVMETVELTTGRLRDVTPAFAWDEGEFDRTRESWLEGHRRFFGRQGIDDPDDLEVVFERFRIVWPEADGVQWLADGVRELRWDERSWLLDAYRDDRGTTTVRYGDEVHEVTALPTLVCERGGNRVGALTFRPRPGGEAVRFSVDVFTGSDDVATALAAGLEELGRRNCWRGILAASAGRGRDGN